MSFEQEWDKTTQDLEGDLQRNERPKWFDANPDSGNLPEIGRQLLEEYSHVPPDQILSHVVSIRDRAFTIWPYACIGQFRFLNYNLPKLPYYQPVLEKLQSGGKFLDAGCCFGQVLRFLVYRERVSGTQLYGFDLEQGFIDFGYELFRDYGKLDANFLTGDLLSAREATGSQGLNTMEGCMDVVHCSSILHIWDWDKMVQAAKRLVSFTRAIPGSMIIGTQMGSRNPGTYSMPIASGSNYRHNEESMKKFWIQVGEETETKWRVDSGTFTSEAITQNLEHSWAQVDPGMCMIWFMVTRL